MNSLRLWNLAIAWPLLLITWGAISAHAPSPSAKQQLAELRNGLREARDKNDWKAYLAGATQISKVLNGSPNSLLEVARADLKLGRTAEARAVVQHILDMGQADDVLLAAPFDAFHDLGRAVAANRAALSQGSLVWEVQDAGLLPEDIDYDATTRRFFLTSVLEKKIVALDAVGKATTFAVAPDNWPMLGLKVDTKRRRLWATEVALEGFSMVPKADQGRSALVCYELDEGKLVLRIEGPEHSALGDMVLAQDGTPIVSDGAGGGIYRVRDGKTLERIDEGEFISPQTPAIDLEGKHLFVPDYLRGIGVLDLSTRKVRWLPMDDKFALAGIDGLYLDHNSLLAVQNGSSPERVAAFELDAAHEKIISQKLIESATSTLGDPTHGVIVGGHFYYIASSGWDILDEHGERRADAKATPARIMRVTLPN
ncbi:MAG: hypothetical protein LAO24_12205 [Acidobacteriia bacterium]|nr:hypothetical protein [Terriglobia bacterium]